MGLFISSRGRSAGRGKMAQPGDNRRAPPPVNSRAKSDWSAARLPVKARPRRRRWYFRRIYTRLRFEHALIISCLIHLMILSVKFDLPSLGMPGSLFSKAERRTGDASLRVTIAARSSIAAQPNAIPSSSPPREKVKRPVQNSSRPVMTPGPAAKASDTERRTQFKTDSPPEVPRKQAKNAPRQVKPAQVKESVKPPPPAKQIAPEPAFVAKVTASAPTPESASKAEELRQETIRREELAAQAAAQEAARLEVLRQEALRQETLREAAAAQAVATQEAVQREVLRQEAMRQAAAAQAAAAQEAAQREALRQEALRQEVMRQEAAAQAAATQEAATREALRREAARQEAAAQAAAAEEAAQREVARLEALRQEAMRQEAAAQAAATQEAAQREAARQDTLRQEAAAQAAAAQEAAQREAMRQEGLRQEAAAQAAAAQEAAQREATRQETLRQEAAAQAAAAQEAAQREAMRQGQEALRREAAGQAAKSDAASAPQQRTAPGASPAKVEQPSPIKLSERPPEARLESAKRRTLLGRPGPDQDLRLRMLAEGWRQKIEQNAPLDVLQAAKSGPYENPVVTVALRRDGSVESVVINRSSGVAAIDDAVRQVVYMLSPFAPFPSDLGLDYDIVEIRRVWSFDVAVRLLYGGR